MDILDREDKLKMFNYVLYIIAAVIVFNTYMNTEILVEELKQEKIAEERIIDNITNK